jgi:hypothetical protein
VRRILLPYALLALVSCAPNDFSYGDGNGGSSAATDCDGEGCVSDCPPGSSRNADGVCEATCGAWQTAITTATPRSISAAGDRVFVTGTSSPDDGRPQQAQLSPLFACSGAAEDAVLPFDGDSSAAGDVGATKSSVFTTGTRESGGNMEAVVVELDASTLAEKSTTTLAGLPAGAAPLALATSANGVWVVGASADATPWLAHVVPGAGTCAFALPGQGEARAVGALDDGAVVAIDRLGALGVVRVDSSSCTPPACNCQVGMQADPKPVAGTDIASPHAIAVQGRTAFVAGHTRVGAAQTVGFVAAVDVDSGSVGATTTWDVGPGNDGFFAVAAGSERLVVGGIAGAAAITDLTAGHGIIAAYALPLADGADPTWSAAKPQLNWIESVAVHPDHGIFALGPADTAGSIALHCDATGC